MLTKISFVVVFGVNSRGHPLESDIPRAFVGRDMHLLSSTSLCLLLHLQTSSHQTKSCCENGRMACICIDSIFLDLCLRACARCSSAANVSLQHSNLPPPAPPGIEDQQLLWHCRIISERRSSTSNEPRGLSGHWSSGFKVELELPRFQPL